MRLITWKDGTFKSSVNFIIVTHYPTVSYLFLSKLCMNGGFEMQISEVKEMFRM